MHSIPIIATFILAVLYCGLICAQELEYPVIVSFGSCDDDEISLDAPDRASIRYYQSPTCDSVQINLEAVNDNCYECARSLVATNETICGNLWTPLPFTISLVESTTGNVLASKSNLMFGEGGSYLITANCEGISAPTIEISTQVEPDDAMWPFFVFLGLLVVFIFLSFTVPLLFKYFLPSVQEHFTGLLDNIDDKNTLNGNTAPLMTPLIQHSDVEGNTNVQSQTAAGRAASKKMPRLKSLDTFRGFALIGMIFVNAGGGGYWFLSHAAWNGLTVADIFFPFFMWIMGCSMALSFVPIVVKGDASYASLKEWWRVLRRSLILFAIGMFLSSHSLYFNKWRIPGVLQYFSFSYFMTASTVLLCLPLTRANLKKMEIRGETDNKYTQGDLRGDNSRFGLSIWHALTSSPLLVYKWEWIIQLIILIVYLSISLGVAAPGCPVGYNGPGGLYDNGSHSQCTGGIHRYIDIQFFGFDHIYHIPTCTALYNCLPYDPEGLLGSLSACSLTYLGLMSGRVLIHYKDHKTRLTMWAFFSVLFLSIAGALCGFSQNEGLIPVNKNLWSTSFVFVNAGLGLIGLSFCYIMVDVWGVWTGAPLLFLGMNSILIYCGQSVFADYFPFYYEIDTNSHENILKRNVLGAFAWCVVAYYCFKIKFFVKV